MRNRKSNHDEHDEDDAHDGFDFRMRLPSPLSEDVERVMTRVIDCAMAVHRQLGPGFLESIYQRAMCIELAKTGLAYEQEKRIDVFYEGSLSQGSVWISSWRSASSWNSKQSSGSTKRIAHRSSRTCARCD